MRLFFVLFLISVFILPYANAQDTLPGFSVSLKPNGKVIISWRNAYPDINQLSIQRSSDSLRNFTTLITVPDPRNQENGFVDTKAKGKKIYYRIFILFPKSKYLFTKSKRAVLEQVEKPVLVSKPTGKDKPEARTGPPVQKQSVPPGQDVTSAVVKAAEEEEKYLILPKIDNSRIFYMIEGQTLKKPTVNNPGKIKAATIEVEKILYVKRRDSVIMMLAASQIRHFSDSLLKKTRDTLLFVNSDTLLIKPFIEIYKEQKEVYKVSAYVYAAKDGNVTIALADCSRKKYYVAFYETDNTPVLEVKDIKDPMLIIDKTNFGHSGWFRFELFEDGKLKEKNRLLIPKD